MKRLPFKWVKAIEAIDFIAHLKPGITQYYIGKIIFFADREHLIDYGRSITGDRFVAMEHGPVPSAIRDILKSDSGSPDEFLDYLDERVVIEHKGNKQHIYSKEKREYPSLSGSDKEYLEKAFADYNKMSFSDLKQVSHEDPAYIAAWEKSGNANEMDMDLWIDRWVENPEVAKRQLHEQIACS